MSNFSHDFVGFFHQSRKLWLQNLPHPDVKLLNNLFHQTILTKFIVLLFLSFIGRNGLAQEIRIGVLRDYTVNHIVFAYNEGSYSVYGDSTFHGSILASEFVELRYLAAKQIQVKINATVVDTVSNVKLLSNKINGSIIYSSPGGTFKERKYRDNVEITAPGSSLTVVNHVDMNNYLGGVVESEGGGGKYMEYYKVQALMSRTYAMKYLGKHEKDGFDLCDRTHCQAYHYQLRFNQVIDTAVRSTDGVVMVDSERKLIDSYFHANCGGQTSEPDYVWNSKIAYLTTFKDTFCIYTKQATWEKRISQETWKNYLVETFNYPIEDSVFGPMIFSFNQPDRCAFYVHPALGIPLRDIREKFGLKSTFFNCYPEGTDVVLRGRGYGHGVGLCQEGAMRMAKFGYSYRQIALYYFPGVVFMNYKTDVFFRQVGDGTY
jgi:stage II sporulation protein D